MVLPRGQLILISTGAPAAVLQTLRSVVTRQRQSQENSSSQLVATRHSSASADPPHWPTSNLHFSSAPLLAGVEPSPCGSRHADRIPLNSRSPAGQIGQRLAFTHWAEISSAPLRPLLTADRRHSHNFVHTSVPSTARRSCPGAWPAVMLAYLAACHWLLGGLPAADLSLVSLAPSPKSSSFRRVF